MKEIKNDTNRWRGYSMFLDWKNQYCKNDYSTQAIYRFNAIPIKLPVAFLYRTRKKILKFVWQKKDPE